MNNYEINKLFQNHQKYHSIYRIIITEYYKYIALTILDKYHVESFEKDKILELSMKKFLNSIQNYTFYDNIEFTNYSIKIILNEIKYYNIQKLKFNNSKKEIYISILEAKNHLEYTLNRSPKISEIANYLNINEEYILEILEIFNEFGMKITKRTKGCKNT